MELDHLVVTCADLAEGTAWLEEALGVPTQAGGHHPRMGTHNRLLSLGPDEYLEVIAPDPDAPAPGRPRWFALDRRRAPGFTNWAVRTDDLDEALDRAPDGSGRPVAMERGDLRWRFAVPEDGEQPLGGASPALLQWDGPHPAPRLDDAGCRLVSVTVRTPHPEQLVAIVPHDARIAVEKGAFALRAVIRTPAGERVLG